MSLNVNSIRIRMDSVIPFLQQHQPHIVGFQEIKVINELFPAAEFEALGYQVYTNGQKSYHGVATLSKQKASSIDYDFVGQKEQRRMIITKYSDDLTVINGYFPQGENRSHLQKFPYKMNFYQEFLSYLAANFNFTKDRVLVMGDLNISPEDIDIGIGESNRLRWLKEGKCSFLSEERDLINKFKQLGFYDTYRKFYPTKNDIFSWFDYRSRGFEANPKRGLRIDHIWVTQPLLKNCTKTFIDYELRSTAKPSDHCAIFAEFN